MPESQRIAQRHNRPGMNHRKRSATKQTSLKAKAGGVESTREILGFFWSILTQKRRAGAYAALIAIGRGMPPLAALALTWRVNEASGSMHTPAWMLALGGVVVVYGLSMMMDWGLRLAGQWIFYPMVSRLGTRFCDLSIAGLLRQDASAIAAQSEARWAATLDRKSDVAGMTSFIFNHIGPPALESAYALATLWLLSRDAWLFGVACGGVALWLVLSVKAQSAIAKRASKLLGVQTGLGDSTASCARAALMAKVFGAQDFLLAQRGRVSAVEQANYAKTRLAQVASEAMQGVVLALCLVACFAVGSRGLSVGTMGAGAFAASMGLVGACFWQLRNLGYAISGVAEIAGKLSAAMPLARSGFEGEMEPKAASEPPREKAPSELRIEGFASLFPAPSGPEGGLESALESASGKNEPSAGPGGASAQGAQGDPRRASLTDTARADRQTEAIQSLRIAAGEKVYVVGPSGAGKTTLSMTLLGLRPWPQGVKTNAAEWAGHWGWAPQTAPLLPASLWENVSMGRCGRQEAIEAARACALEGLDWDAPARDILSGGEKLRLATARALCSGRAAMLLDEPTAGLDATRERALMEHLASLPQTMVLITHRLNAIPPGATVWVLERGSIVELGRSQDLLADPQSRFSRLFDDFNHQKQSGSSGGSPNGSPSATPCGPNDGPAAMGQGAGLPS